jgi:hypothetical protein
MSPQYMKQHAMYLPWWGSHLTIMLDGSNTLLLSSNIDNYSWAFSIEMTNTYEENMK